MQLHEEYRPRTWNDVIGQEKILARLERIRRRGLAGRAFWLSGASGTGKTTIGRLIAAEVASNFCIEELDVADLTPARLRDLERTMQTLGMGDKSGRAWLIDEAHGLRRLLVLLERLPSHVVVVFTSTVDGSTPAPPVEARHQG